MEFFADPCTRRATIRQPISQTGLFTKKTLWRAALLFGVGVSPASASPQLPYSIAFPSEHWELLIGGSLTFLLLCLGFIFIVIRKLIWMESALRASEERFHHMAVHLPQGMIYQFLLKKNGSVSFPYVSPSCRELFALDPEVIQANAHVLIERIHPDDRGGFEQSVAHSAQTLTPWQWEGRFFVKGETLWMQCASRPQRQKNGDILWDGMLMNVTVNKRAERAILASEKKYRTLYDSGKDAIVRTDLQDRIEECNQAFLDMLGYSLDELVGRSCTDFTPAQWTVQKEKIVAQQVMVRGYSDEHEKEFIKKDGTTLPVAVRLWSTKNEQGEPESLWRFVRDISAYKQTEIELRRLALVAQKAPNAVLMTDITGRIQWVNESFTRSTGYTLTEVIGRKPGEFLQGRETDPYTVEQIHVALQRQEPLECEVYNYRKDGKGIWLSLSITPVRDETGQLQGFIGLQTNITERKRTEEELARYAQDLEAAKIAQEENAAQLTLLVEELELAKQRAEEAARVKSEFLTTMSHEIRTPMNGVIGMTGLLLDTDLTLEQREYAETVQNSGEALLTIINDILDFSKIEAGKMEFEIINFDLRTAMEETIELFAKQASSKGLELGCLIHTDVPTALRGDPGRVRQVLINLVGNAIKFTTKGEVIVEVKIVKKTPFENHSTMQEHPEGTQDFHSLSLCFSVRDTGIGIPETHRNRLFQSFSQIDASTTRKYGGTGLGLAICKRLTELMGGEIGVDSIEGKGSTFWFTVQLERQPPTAIATIPRPNLAGLHALIVDDNDTNRQIFRQQLTAWRVTSDEASDGLQALSMLRRAAADDRPYDFVLLDFIMPSMDGLELAKIVRADPLLASNKLLLLTSVGHRGDGHRAREAGLDGYLTKPVRQAHLWGCLTTLLGRVAHETASPPLVTRHAVTEAQTRNRPLILIAEDNPVNQKLAVRLVEKLGYRADIAANGRETLTALERIPYALVLMDCQMPEMDGLEATREIRKREAQLRTSPPAPSGKLQRSSQMLTSQDSHTSRRLPIIAMTANAMQGDRERCLEAGMDDYITKPIKPEALKKALTHWITMGENDLKVDHAAA